jgi:hypothetical protein
MSAAVITECERPSTMLMFMFILNQFTQSKQERCKPARWGRCPTPGTLKTAERPVDISESGRHRANTIPQRRPKYGRALAQKLTQTPRLHRHVRFTFPVHPHR